MRRETYVRQNAQAPNFSHKLTNRWSAGPAAEPPRVARNCTGGMAGAHRSLRGKRQSRHPPCRGEAGTWGGLQLRVGVRRIGPSTPRGLLLKSILFQNTRPQSPFQHFGSIVLAAAEQSSISSSRSTRWHERTRVAVGHVRGGAVPDFLHCYGHAAGSCHERPKHGSVIVPSLREGRAALGHCSALWATSSARALINGIAARATGLLLPWRVGTGKDIGRSFCPGALAPAA